MTKQEFESTKVWLEKITNISFDGKDADGDNEAVFVDNKAFFCKSLENGAEISLVFSDDDCYLILTDYSRGYNEMELYKTDDRNAHQCADVFHHIYHHN